MASPIMTSRLAHRTTTIATRALVNSSRMRPSQQRLLRQSTKMTSCAAGRPISRHFSTNITTRAGLMPHSEEPEAPQEQPSEERVTQATEISDDEYNELADQYMESLNDRAEQLQETREDVEVEYAAGVLSITFPPNGTYVVNKQPPNKQVWLSSPLSGPKRYDYVLAGESMHQKQGGGRGEWVYLRDGTNLSGLLAKELGIVVDPHRENDPSTDPAK